jgi:hypothetical protein
MMSDVIFSADHFVMVTTIETTYSPGKEEAEDTAWERLVDEYGVDWVNATKKFINKISVE